MRELCEETGYDVRRLVPGRDYVPVPVGVNDYTTIKKICFFVFLLLRPAHTLDRQMYDAAEIIASKWVRVLDLRRHTIDKRNRTLSSGAINTLDGICHKIHALYGGRAS